MSGIDQIESMPKILEPRRIMLYGTHGIGKSTFGAMSPNPIFIQTEDGLGNVDADRFPLSSSLKDVMDNIEELTVNQTDYKTLVIDSLDWLERLIWSQVCEDEDVDSIEKIGYGKGYSFAVKYWDEFLESLSDIRNIINMNIILIAHAKIEKFMNPETDSYDRYSPRLNKFASSILQEWCDEVLFATYSIHTKQVDEGFRKRTQGVGGSERIIKTTEHPAYLAKNKLNLPDELELNWDVYAKFLNNQK